MIGDESMISLRYKDWKITAKIISISAFTLLLVILGLQVYYLPFLGDRLMDEKKYATRSEVETAMSLIVRYNDRVTKGEFSLQEAQQRAVANIIYLRYAKNEYFFIIDKQVRMVAHPIKPELNGKDMSDMKDPAGKLLFVEMANIAKEKGHGFINYLWAKPGEEKPVSKLTYVESFEPWGWVVGTGIYVDNVYAEVSKMKTKLTIAIIVVSLGVILFVIWVSYAITKPLRAGINFASTLAKGDFSSEDIAVNSKDEAGELAAALNTTKNSLGMLVTTAMGSVTDSATQMVSASEELSSTAIQMTKRLDEQSKKTSQVATAATEMSQTVVDIAKNASSIATSAVETLDEAKKGADVVGQTIDEVKEISSTVSESSRIITSLGERSKQIYGIVDVIKSIANQTNLLALNAAIEAARAGEQGRGFAVVADEVRKLAEKTTASTSEVGSLVTSIQEEIGQTVTAMSESLSRVEKGVVLSEEAGAALNKILERVNGLQSMVQHIASATEEMSTTSESISSDIEVVAEVSREASSGATEVEKASGNIAKLSSDLHEVTKKFKSAASAA